MKIALLAGSAIVPALGLAHVEGTEVTDPNTPPAVLTFDSAAEHYSGLQSAPRSWTGLFDADGRFRDAGASDGSAGRRGAAEQAPATTER